MFGISVSRKIENRRRVTASCRDLAMQKGEYIIALDDDDLMSLVDSVKNEHREERLNLLHERFNELIL